MTTICACTLPYYNPRACEHCANNRDYDSGYNYDLKEIDYPLPFDKTFKKPVKGKRK